MSLFSLSGVNNLMQISPQNVDKRVCEPGAKLIFAAVIIRTSHTPRRVGFISDNQSQPCFLALIGRRYYERVEDLRCHLEETPWDWSSGGPSASSCGAPHPKLGIYSGGMSGSGDWQVSGPLKGQPLHWKLGQLLFLHGNNWKDSIAGVCTGTGSFHQWWWVKSISF